MIVWTFVLGMLVATYHPVELKPVPCNAAAVPTPRDVYPYSCTRWEVGRPLDWMYDPDNHVVVGGK